jgi:hypothetical protein
MTAVTLITEPLSEPERKPGTSNLGLGALPVSIRDIWAARLRISSMIWRTSLLPTATLSRMTNTTLRIKTENLQRTCSFKFRGGLNAVLQLTEEQRARGGIRGPALGRQVHRLHGPRCQSAQDRGNSRVRRRGRIWRHDR